MWMHVDRDKKAYLSSDQRLYHIDGKIECDNYLIVTKKENGICIEIHGNDKFEPVDVSNYKSVMILVVEITVAK